MPYFDQFTDDQRDMLAALPYRAGLWIGESDATGGDEASDAERRALESIVTGFVEDFCKSEFVEELMRQTLARKDHWSDWRQNIGKVPAECRQAIEMLAVRLDRKEITALKHNLLEIAMAVAMAYREFDDSAPLFEKLKIYSSYYYNRYFGFLKNEKALSVHDALNISRSELAAIAALNRALRLDHAEGLEPSPV